MDIFEHPQHGVSWHTSHLQPQPATHDRKRKASFDHLGPRDFVPAKKIMGIGCRDRSPHSDRWSLEHDRDFTPTSSRSHVSSCGHDYDDDDWNNAWTDRQSSALQTSIRRRRQPSPRPSSAGTCAENSLFLPRTSNFASQHVKPSHNLPFLQGEDSDEDATPVYEFHQETGQADKLSRQETLRREKEAERQKSRQLRLQSEWRKRGQNPDAEDASPSPPAQEPDYPCHPRSMTDCRDNAVLVSAHPPDPRHASLSHGRELADKSAMSKSDAAVLAKASQSTPTGDGRGGFKLSQAAANDCRPKSQEQADRRVDLIARQASLFKEKKQQMLQQQGFKASKSAFALGEFGLDDEDEADTEESSRPEHRGAESILAHRKGREAQERRNAAESRSKAMHTATQAPVKMAESNANRDSDSKRQQGMHVRISEDQLRRVASQSGQEPSEDCGRTEPQQNQKVVEETSSAVSRHTYEPATKLGEEPVIPKSQKQQSSLGETIQRHRAEVVLPNRAEHSRSTHRDAKNGLQDIEPHRGKVSTTAGPQFSSAQLHSGRASDVRPEFRMVSPEKTSQSDVEDAREESVSRQKADQRAQRELEEHLQKIKQQGHVRAMLRKQQDALQELKTAEDERNRHLAEMHSNRTNVLGPIPDGENETTTIDVSLPGSKQAPAAAIVEAKEARAKRIEAKRARNEHLRLAEQQDQLRKEQIQPAHSRSNNNTVEAFGRLDKDARAHLMGSGMPHRQNERAQSFVALPAGSRSKAFEGPFSLNSEAGQAAVQCLTEEQQPSKTGRAHKRKLGEILPEDVKILRWRNQGMLFSEMARDSQQLFGHAKSRKALSERYKQVKEALDAVGVPKDLLKLVEDGAIEARQKLNECVHGHWPKAGEQPKQVPKQAIPIQRSQPVSTRQSSPGPTVDVSSAWDDVAGEPRPRFGGKTLNKEALLHYFKIMEEEYAERRAQEDESGDDDDNDESASTTTMEYCHFTYQVMRREVSDDQLADGETLEEQQWIRYGNAFETPREANEAAMRQVFRTQRKKVYSADTKFSFEVWEDGNGLAQLRQKADDEIIVEVGVQAETRTFADGFLPRRDVEYAPRTIYLIKICTTREVQPSDTLFEEPHKVTFEALLIDTAFTDYNLANDRAIEEFVRRTFKPKSIHLTWRSFEVQEKQNEYKLALRELGTEGGEDLFVGDYDDEDGHTVVIKVEEGNLAGPRNL